MVCYQYFLTTNVCILSIFIKSALLQNQYSDELSCSYRVFKNIEINAFTYPSRQLRLNISWREALGNFDTFRVNINTMDINCFIPDNYQLLNVNSSFLIEPSLNMLNPAETPNHLCQYDFVFYAVDVNGSCFNEIVEYTVPECVNNVCHCETGAPYNLTDVRELSNKTFEFVFSSAGKHLNVSLEDVFNQILYTRKKSSNHTTRINHNLIVFDDVKKSLKFPISDVIEKSFYVFHVDLSLDDCTYHFEKEVQIRESMKIIHSSNRYLIYAVPVLGLIALLVIYISFTRWPKVMWKLRKMFPELPDIQTAPNVVLLNEVENVQYVPLDFKEDHYEIPRNKIVLKNKIGGGSFGTVYKCQFYPMDSTKCEVAAAKMPIENAPEEELKDFLAEISIMKKIAANGGHQNVIKMFACVTLEKPYVMVMELVPCGSLKGYLNNLRREWESRKQRASDEASSGAMRTRHFFPDNMVFENYLDPNGVEEVETNKNRLNLKYSSLDFQDTTANSSSGSESYITPDGLRTPSIPSTPPTPAVTVHIPSTIEEYQGREQPRGIPIVKVTSPPRLSRLRRKSSSARVKIQNDSKSKPANFCGLNLPSPNSPESITSSGLPSCTETLLTPLYLDESPSREERLLDLTPSIQPVLDSRDLQNFALQLANGMAFLESIDVTHRDLAARNILITHQKMLKISDFGMSRVGLYIHNPQKRQPLRWMAPEAIEERKCDTKTDVWSFGVVLWEIGSLGAFPYGALSNDLVLVHIRQGKTLERPEMCTDKLYRLMQKCWLKNPSERPTFNAIAKSLDESSGKIYVDFDQISPKYVFPPIQQKVDE